MAQYQRRQAQKEEKQQPIKKFVVSLGQDAWLSVSVWERKVDTKNGGFTAFDTSWQKSIKDDKNEWQNVYSLRQNEIPLLVQLLQMAFSFILDVRSENAPNPS